MTLMERVFRYIQNDPELWQKWNNARTDHARTVMMVRIAYQLGKLKLETV